jgi:hypothetical protein
MRFESASGPPPATAATAIQRSPLTAATPGGRAMTRRHDPAWVWMIGALGGALALAGAVLAGYGTGPVGIGQAVRYTARWSFLFFWLSYAGGAMAILFGSAFAGLARKARALGLAFATALQVHIGLVVWLGVVIGQIPLVVVLPGRTVLRLSAGAAVLRNRNAHPGTSVAATALPGHDLHSDRLRPGFCAGRNRPEDTALALLRRICAVRPVEPYCNPAAPCRVSSPALRIVAGFDETGETNTD